MKHLRLLTLSALLGLPLSALAQSDTPPAPPADAPVAPVEPSAMDAPMFYQLLIAEMALRDGDGSVAFSYLLDAAQKYGDERLYRRSVEVAQQARAGEAVLRAAKAWKAAFPGSKDATRQVLFTLLNLNRIAETSAPLSEELARMGSAERSVVIGQLPRLYARASDKTVAAQTVEKALQLDLANAGETGAQAWAVVGRLWMQAEQPAQVRRAASHLRGVTPPSESAALLGIDMLEQKMPEGEPLVQHYLRSSTASDIRMAYIRHLLLSQRYVQAKVELLTAVERDPNIESAWLILGSLQMQDRQTEEARRSLNKHLELAQQNAIPGAEQSRGVAQAYLYLSDLEVQKPDLPQALVWLDRITSPKDLAAARSRRAQVLARQGKLDQARQAIRDIPESEAGDAKTKLLAEAQILRDAQQYRAAYDLLAQRNTGPHTDADVTYEQAMLAEKLGDLADMERLLRSIMSSQPDYHAAYNALGYSLAERNLRLSEARQLIQKALTFAPNDPFISDSLGWVEYRLGNLSTAANILEAAFKVRPDAEIGSHLGEVLWHMGQQDKALDYWKAAQQLSPDNQTLSATLKRLQIKW